MLNIAHKMEYYVAFQNKDVGKKLIDISQVFYDKYFCKACGKHHGGK